MIAYTLFKNPTDYPNKYVLRQFTLKGAEGIPSNTCLVAETREEIEKSIPKGLVWIERLPMDDKCILGVWI